MIPNASGTGTSCLGVPFLHKSLPEKPLLAKMCFVLATRYEVAKKPGAKKGHSVAKIQRADALEAVPKRDRSTASHSAITLSSSDTKRYAAGARGATASTASI
eukprot:scaffold574_cov246-Pinguiococcus_pyrenoidosus.AAC.9